MKLYIFSILFLLSVTISFAQTEEVILKKSFKSNSNTTLSLDLDNVSIVFEESFDGKIHFDYTMTFGRYSKRKREIILKQTKSKILKNKDLINLKVKNSEFLGINLNYYPNYTADYKSDSAYISIKDFMRKEAERKNVYKTKDSLLREIGFSEGSDLTDFLKKNQKKYKLNKYIKNKKVIIKRFVIKIPKSVKIRIKAIHSDLTFNYDISQPFVLNSFKGFFKFKNITSKESEISASNGILQAYKMSNTSLNLRDMNKVVLGSFSNSILESETSKIQIGEVGTNLYIKDFDSDFNFYNYNKNFTKFNFEGDYSELYLYNVKDTNFSMDVSGFNTALNMDGKKTSFGASKEKELTKILHKKRKENSPFLGNIDVILKNGILNIK